MSASFSYSVGDRKSNRSYSAAAFKVVAAFSA